MRLVGGSVPSEGRVEVLHDGQWSTVCDNYWDIKDANVICRQLGFTNATTAWPDAHFGPGTGQILMDNVNCHGNEERMQDCVFLGWGSHTCVHLDDASVTCDPGGCYRHNILCDFLYFKTGIVNGKYQYKSCHLEPNT